MAGIVRLNELPEGSGSLSNDDIFVFMDDPSGGGVTKKISLSQIGTAILANDSRWDYFLPVAPTSVLGTPGDGSVQLAWTAPSGSVIPVTDYVIQYSIDNGTTWTTFADVVSPSTSVVVNNLTNDTSYKFRVRALNGIGLGSYSAITSSITPSANENPIIGIEGLVAYYLSNTGVVTDENNYVSEWQDQSGNNNHVTASNDDRPTLISSGINNLPSIDFNGSTNILSLSHNSTLDFTTLSIFGVYKRTAGTGLGNPWLMWKNNAAWGVAYMRNGANITLSYLSGSGSTDYADYSSDTNNMDPHLLGLTVGSNGTFLYLDNHTSSNLGPTFTNAGTGPLQIGGYNQSFGGGNERFLGQISEIMLFNRVLTTEEISTIKNYISIKYDILIS